MTQKRRTGGSIGRRVPPAEYRIGEPTKGAGLLRIDGRAAMTAKEWKESDVARMVERAEAGLPLFDDEKDYLVPLENDRD